MHRIGYVFLLCFAAALVGCNEEIAIRRYRENPKVGISQVRMAAQRLVESGNRGVPVLLEASRDTNTTIRGIAASSLLRACWQSPPSAEVAQRFVELLHDPCPDVREAALGSIYDHFRCGVMHKTNVTLTLRALDCAIPDVVTMLKSEEAHIAIASACALSGFALAGCVDRRVLDALIEGLQSDKAKIVEYCANGLNAAPPGTVFRGAVAQGLVAKDIGWLTAFKLALFVAVIAGIAGIRPDGDKD